VDGPRDPIVAVTHPDPYPYYRDLVTRAPIYRDDALGLWVVSSAAAVTAALTSEVCRVRPAGEPVPAALVGSAAGELFARLVRMNDGTTHAILKPRVSAVLAAFDGTLVLEHARRHARALAERGGIGHLIVRLPVYVLASLLGVADERLEDATRWTADLARCFAPGPTSAHVAAGALAARELCALLAARGRDGDDVAVANGVGFLFQSYDATAGLIGNTLVALGRYPEVFARVMRDAELIAAVVREVVRFDAPVQNTRRFLAHDSMVASRPMKGGEGILVVLAAANHDAAANPSPERFEPFRAERRAFTFGVGPHACPGESVAVAIACAGVEALLAAGVDPGRLAADVRYRPAPNVRIPLL
jgi:cytochrome P450